MEADVGFCFPTRELTSALVKLKLFDPVRHSKTFIEQTADKPEIFAHMPIGPFANVEEFQTKYFYPQVCRNNTRVAFAIIDKTRPGPPEDGGALAGIVTYSYASVDNQLLEIAFMVVFPGFQRTHVTTHTVGLMLQYALDPPDGSDPSKGGLGLRKVLWQTATTNAASRATAKKMGFEQEGILRWDRVFHDAVQRKKQGNGKEMPAHADKKAVGRDTVYCGLCWDEWEDGKRRMVQQLMDGFLHKQE
ncbi:hypothetical protein H109_07506 [Trichophyton interdigitale MR816]|uniref:N-acetyltransferase domain-containing protein n=1 Tax=Trichophyton interdigitale (strain MR816) TaxID=1215338 RepID=A0A059IY25_TRIIM|nr:hypothetical protein H101_01861 [Trichophyton interdigitale H6]KDB20531.1 hypothetical protein H109_07506 [Trichophyton interdigitale MR816]